MENSKNSFLGNFIIYNILDFNKNMTGYSELQDIELLTFLVKGDGQAFTEIYSRYWRRLIALAYSHTKDKYLSEEMVQEVFLSLWNRKASLEIKSLNAYLATSVKFAIFKHISTRNRQVRIIEGIADYRSYELSDEILEAKFLEEYVNKLVEELPEKCKMVYVYSRKQEMSVEEIGLKMNIAKKTVEAHLTKALKVLRLNLKELMILVCILNRL